MKRIAICIVISLFIASATYSQGNYFYDITITGKQGSPLSGVKVWLKEKNSGLTIIRYSNYAGKVTFDIPPGHWSVNLEGLPDYDEIELKDKEKGGRSLTLSYDKEKTEDETRIINLRPSVIFSEIYQDKIKVRMPASDSCIVKIKLYDLGKKPVKKASVNLVGVDYAIIYKEKTNSLGIATFYVPKGVRYAIDVDDIENFGFTQKLNYSGVQTVSLEYQPTYITETNINDTIRQDLQKPIRPTTARTLAEIYVMDIYGEPMADENVFLQKIKTNEVYIAKTDKSGIATFLIPRGDKYLLHFDYQRDVDVLRLTHIQGLNSVQYQIKYIPDPKLQYPENFIPKPDELFLTEFDNFITKQFPDPKEEKAGFFLNWGNNKVNERSKEAVLEIGFATTADETFINNKVDVNLVFVIDKSGSMAGYDRIESMKESMIKFIDKLAPHDHVSIIVFNEDAYLVMPLQEKGDGKTLKFIINELEAGGYTNIYKGMVMGYEELLKHFDEKKINKLILLTDGYGETEPAIVIDKSKEYNAMGLGLSAIGVGEDYNYALLSLLAEESNGLMTHAGESGEIYSAFEKQLSSLIYPIGRDAKLEIVYNKKVEFDQLYGFPVKVKENNKAVIEIGDLYMGMNKIALAHFVLNKPDKTIEDNPVEFIFTWFDIEKQEYVEIRQQAKLEWEEKTEDIKAIVDNQQKKLYAIAIMNQSIKVMAEAFAAEDVQGAKNALQRASEQVKDIYRKADDEDVQKLIDKMEDYAISIDNYIRNKTKK